ncbi:O-linked N-acetylglucosamine transferase, SPINDLY family [Thioploca ingrica]|uniref:protein O-GlcNAc transferase n=1 Tax=Thioploca ingrica TaxID=40754 RepID=A0A090AFS5_9GAMM|nr:O-linked N-acetylglucosamine transferase, SPINDLY family [Thioploca ingrica]
MATISQLLNLAIQHHQQGQLSQAEILYKQILAQDRYHLEVLHLLGVLYSQLGQYQEGVRLIKKAIKKNGRSAPLYSNLGAALVSWGKPKEAITACRQAIALNPNNPEPYNNLGLALKAQDQLAAAMTSYRKAIAIKPDFADAYSNLGELLREQGQLEEAIASYQQALAINPQFAKAYNNLGLALKEQGQFQAAVTHYQRALAIDPNYVKAYFNLGTLLFSQRELEPAALCFTKLITIKPDYLEAYISLIGILFEQGKLDETIAYCQQALAIDPNCAEAHITLAGTFFRLGKLEAVVKHYRQALTIQPDNYMAHSGLLMAMHYSLDYDVPTVFAEHLHFAKQHVKPLQKEIKPHPNDKSPQRRLKMGYVSPDFRYHSTTFYMEPVLAAHHQDEFEIFCYADVLTPDAATQRLQGYVEHWRDIINLSDEQVAEQIRADQIDILVDLAGHTDRHRLLVFARKPAPIQVTYLGYAGTTGLATIDYKLTDEVIDPPGETEVYHTEELVRLPVYRIVQFNLENSPPINSLPALQSGYITFASFNNFSKVTSYIIDVWAKILTTLPNARLLIVVKDADKETTQQQVKASFTQRGVAVEQLTITGMRPFYQYLELHHQVDVGLDPFPHMGATTTFVSLWMGVPVITLMGPKPASKGGGPLKTLGLDRFVTYSPEDYINVAWWVTEHLEELNELRLNLREKMLHSPLMDANHFTRAMEAAYRQMWYKWCKHQR